MSGFLGLGKYLFIVPMLVFGVIHLKQAKEMSTLPPFGGQIMVYITGIALLAASISLVIGKWDKLACVLLSILLLSFAVTIHLPAMLNAQDEMAKAASLSNFVKDIGLAGGALMAARLAKDHSVIG